MRNLQQAVFDTIGEIFGVDPNSINRSTVAEDVDGWDSLSHTILILRLEKTLKVQIDDQIAQNAANVGELIDAIRDQIAQQAS